MIKWFALCCVAVLCLGGGARADLAFEKTSSHVTSGLHDMKISFKFPFVNRSTSEVKIKKILTSCSCLTAYMPDDKVITMPGETNVVMLDMDLGAFGGKVEKYATVVTSEGQEIRLDLSVQIPEFVQMEPRTLKWNVGEPCLPKVMKLRIHKDLMLKLTQVSVSSNDFDYEPKTVVEGREYEIKVTPKSTTTPCFSMLSVQTNATEARYKKCLGFLSVNEKKKP